MPEMDPTATGRAYDQVARDWQQNTPPAYGMPQLERAIAFAKNRGDALDIGCGSRGREIDVLLSHGFRPEGIDVSAQMIALARERHPAVAFHEADICAWPLAKSYDFITAWDSIWHVPLAQQEPVLRKICEGLAPGGVFLFTTVGLDEPSDTIRGPRTGASRFRMASWACRKRSSSSRASAASAAILSTINGPSNISSSSRRNKPSSPS